MGKKWHFWERMELEGVFGRNEMGLLSILIECGWFCVKPSTKFFFSFSFLLHHHSPNILAPTFFVVLCRSQSLCYRSLCYRVLQVYCCVFKLVVAKLQQVVYFWTNLQIKRLDCELHWFNWTWLKIQKDRSRSGGLVLFVFKKKKKSK